MDADHVELHTTTFLGLHTRQLWRDFQLWEAFLKQHVGLKALVEVGTYQGGFSVFLRLWAAQLGAQFWTFDRERFPGVDSPAAQRVGLERCFVRGDVFLEGKPRLLEVLADEDNHPLLLFCDGGNKSREFQMFVPYLKPGDLVAVHDWGDEFFPKDVEPVAHLVEPVFADECAATGSLTRFWKRVSEKQPATNQQPVKIRRESQRRGWGNLAVGVRIAKHPEPSFFTAWTALLTGGLRNGDTVLMPAAQMPAHWASNKLAQNFLRGDKDTLLMLDDDMTFPMDAVKRMRENEGNWEYDVVMGLCTHRVWPPKPVVMQLMEQPPLPFRLRGDHFGSTPKFEVGGVIEVDAVGLAFTFIRRRVLEAMVDEEWGLKYSYFFDYGVGMESDDISFCRRCRELGFRMGVDTTIEIGHIGAQPLGWQDYERWQASQHTVDVTSDDLVPILEAAAELPDVEERARECLEAIRGRI